MGSTPLSDLGENAMSENKGKMYCVCYGTPSPRAVVLGWSETEPVVGETIVLTGARMVLYWSEECGGLYGLITDGPKTGTRITHAVERYSITVVEWGEVSERATEGIRSWPAY